MSKDRNKVDNKVDNDDCNPKGDHMDDDDSLLSSQNSDRSRSRARSRSGTRSRSRSGTNYRSRSRSSNVEERPRFNTKQTIKNNNNANLMHIFNTKILNTNSRIDKMDESLNKLLELMTNFKNPEAQKCNVASQNMVSAAASTSSAIIIEPNKQIPSSSTESVTADNILTVDDIMNQDINMTEINNTYKWEIVGGKRQRVVSPDVIQMKKAKGANNSNKFRALALDDEEEGEIITNLPSTVKPQVGRAIFSHDKNKNKKNLNSNSNSNSNNLNSNSNSSNTPNRDTRDSLAPKKGSDKLPPIIVYNLQQKSLRDSLEVFESMDYRVVKGPNGNRNTIKSSDPETRQNIINILDANKSKYFSFTPKVERGFNLIFKYISKDYTADDILAELEELGMASKVDKIVPLRENSRSIYNFFIVKLKPGCDSGEFTDLKTLFYSSIKVEKFNRTDIIQCFRCQRPGHVARNCRMNPRCVKCSEEHQPGSCKLAPNVDKKLLTCVLCKEQGHPANFRGCSILKKILDDKIKNKSKIQRSSNTEQVKFVNDSINRLVSPQISYANIAKVPQISSAVAGPSNPGNKFMDILNKEAFEHFGCDFETLDSKFATYIKKIKESNNAFSRKTAILDFIFDINYV